MTNVKATFLLVTSCLLITACGGSTDPTLLPPDEQTATLIDTPTPTNTHAPIGESNDTILAKVNVPFQLRIGQRAETEDLVITFVGMGVDSRCPQGANCIWEGQAKVVVRLLGVEPYPDGGAADKRAGVCIAVGGRGGLGSKR